MYVEKRKEIHGIHVQYTWYTWYLCGIHGIHVLREKKRDLHTVFIDLEKLMIGYLER